MAQAALNGEQSFRSDERLPAASNAEPMHKEPPRPYLTRQVNKYLTSLPILVCCFASGCIDAAVFNAWGVFACIQTGNTIILALGAAQLPENHKHAWLLGLVPVVFFFLGAFTLGRIGRPLGLLRRYFLALQFLTQTILITISAALITAKVLPNDQPEGVEPFTSIIALAMLAFQAGMQSATARQLGLNEIPTTVLTSVYCDLGNDPKLFAPFRENWARNRRVASAVCILIGGICGGWLSRTPIGMAGALWLAAGLKLVVSIAWTFWPEGSEVEEK